MVHIFSFLALVTFRIAFRSYLKLCQIHDPQIGASKQAKSQNSCLTTLSCPGIGFLVRHRTGSNHGALSGPKIGTISGSIFMVVCNQTQKRGFHFGCQNLAPILGPQTAPSFRKYWPKKRTRRTVGCQSGFSGLAFFWVPEKGPAAAPNSAHTFAAGRLACAYREYVHSCGGGAPLETGESCPCQHSCSQ